MPPSFMPSGAAAPGGARANRERIYRAAIIGLVVWNIAPLLGSSILLYSSAYLLSTHALEIDPSLRVIRASSELLGLRWRVYSHGFDEVIRVQRTADEDTGDSGVIVVKGNKISNKYVAEWILGDEQEIADAIGVPFVDRT